MFSFRTMAKVGAAALAFVALSKIRGHCRDKSPAECAGRVKGLIRRRKRTEDMDLTSDVI